MSFAFAGTPDFASWVLFNLIGLGKRPSLVISQPDRPQGRGRKVRAPSVAVEADRLGIECIQTEDINESAVLERLRLAGVPTLVVASFGQMLRRSLLESCLCLNVHTSLLPMYRGAAPIERALAAGEPRTGVTIMRMTEKLDEGPWALQKSLSLSLLDDAGSVARALGVLGAIGAAQVLDALSDGTVVWIEQQGPASYADRLRADDRVLGAAQGAKVVHDQVRSLSPSIGARAASGGIGFKVLRSWPYGQSGLGEVPLVAGAVADVPGGIATGGGRLFIGCAEGAIEVLAIQPAGKGRMTASAFLRGYGARLSDRLESMIAGRPGCPATAGEESP